MRSTNQSSSRQSSVAKICSILSLMICCGLSIQGQTVFGRIGGTVTDKAGAVIPNATVTVTNTATNLVRTATTDEGGFYTVTNLPVGTYSVLVEQKGFKRAVQGDNVLAADARLTVDITLELGEVSETVQVTANSAGETVNTTSGEVARVVDLRQVQNLALNGRNYMQLVTLIPGAAILDEDQLALTTSLSISQAAINGNRPNYNSLSVDGGFNMDSGSNNSQVNNVGIDFIQEVKIQTSNFSAEYGRNAGAAVNIVTRGGGNAYHGSVFEFIRNDKLDARNYFSPKRTKLRFNNFGWNFNGPIKKDKFFFFGGQEYKIIRQDSPPVSRNLPTRAERLGDFSSRTGTLNVPTGYTAINPATGAVVATGQPIPGRNLANLRLNGNPVLISADGKAIAAVFSAMEKLAVSYVDTPTASNTVFQQPNPLTYREDNVRLDYRFNEKHSIFGRYLHDHYDLIDPYGTFITSQLPTIPTNRLRPGWSYQVSETWLISPKLINEAKINATWNGQRIPPVGEFWKRSTYGFTYQQLFSGGRYDNGIPNVTFAGGQGYSNFSGPSASLLSPTADIAGSDNLTIIHGKHSLKAGALVIRNRKDQNGRSGYTGNLTFNTGSGATRSTGNSFADALLGNFRSYNEADNDPIGFFRFTQYEAYATDNWKAARNLSFEFGARLYHFQPTYTQANNVANFDPRRYDPSQAVTIVGSTGLIDPTKGGNRFNGLVRAGDGIPINEQGRVSTSAAALALVPVGAPRGFFQPAFKIAPRFGFAYDPFGDSKTSIRGGFGIFYDKVEGNLIFSQVNVPPFVNTPNFDNGNLSNFPAATNALIANINAIDPNLDVSYSMNYSLGVQRELPHGFFVEANFVGNQGRHLIRQPDLNQPSFAALTANLTANGGPNFNVNALRPYKGYNQILYRLSDANSNYNGLQLYAAKRKGNLELTAAYTWSKTLTDTSGNGDGLDVGEDPFNRHANYGPATFDRRHIFVATYDYHLPFFKALNGVGKAVLSGWEVSGITRFQSGGYFTPTASTSIGTRRAKYLGGPVLVSDPGAPALTCTGTCIPWVNTTAFAAADPGQRGNAGVGIIQGPALKTWDISARKQFAINERFKLRFQVDFFNVFNRTNFRSPAVVVTSGGFGAITTAGPARNIQFGLKLNF
ncbi:MAG TPA: carboxypeptidase-like regulatory domain-containing protein [Pyrinomonadaceae bacterium]|nr:carboxypeptidase-like regulatory domain-containing protein [Pyrinomonadaceae bacterium]